MEPQHPLRNSNDISDELLSHIHYFKEAFPANRVSATLRKVFIAYLRTNHEALHAEFGDMLDDIDALFTLLDAFADDDGARKPEGE